MSAPGHRVPPQLPVEGQPEGAQPSAAVSEVMQQVPAAAMPEQVPADSAPAASASGARRAGRKRSSAPGKHGIPQSIELADPGAVMLEQTAADPEFTAPVSDARKAGRRQSVLPSKPKPTRLPGADTQKPATIRTRRQTVAAVRPASAGKSVHFLPLQLCCIPCSQQRLYSCQDIWMNTVPALGNNIADGLSCLVTWSTACLKLLVTQFPCQTRASELL